MAFKHDKTSNHLHLTEEYDRILPVDSASNVYAPAAIILSRTRQLRSQRAAAAIKWKKVEEDAAP